MAVWKMDDMMTVKNGIDILQPPLPSSSPLLPLSSRLSLEWSEVEWRSYCPHPHSYCHPATDLTCSRKESEREHPTAAGALWFCGVKVNGCHNRYWLLLFGLAALDDEKEEDWEEGLSSFLQNREQKWR